MIEEISNTTLIKEILIKSKEKTSFKSIKGVLNKGKERKIEELVKRM